MQTVFDHLSIATDAAAYNILSIGRRKPLARGGTTFGMQLPLHCGAGEIDADAAA